MLALGGGGGGGCMRDEGDGGDGTATTGTAFAETAGAGARASGASGARGARGAPRTAGGGDGVGLRLDGVTCSWDGEHTTLEDVSVELPSGYSGSSGSSHFRGGANVRKWERICAKVHNAQCALALSKSNIVNKQHGS